MATSNGYDYGIRQGLNQKGITNDRITYDTNKGVLVDGQSFYKPEKVYEGTSFTNQQNFNQAWDTYNKGQQQAAANAANAGTQANAGYNYNPYQNNSMINNNPYTSQADKLIQDLINYGKNQQAFDPYSSSQYQAAQAQAQRAAGQSTRAAQEAYGSAGFGRSTGLGERVAGINNDATEFLMTQVLPQIEAQEAARRQQEYNNMLSALQPLMGQQGRADSLVQQDFDNRITEGQLTGNYMNPEATALIDQILGLKKQAEAPGLANTDVKALSAQADQYRNRLAALGYDPSLFGANVNAQTAGGNRGVATRTLAGQAQDLANKESNWGAYMDIVNQTQNLGQGPQANWGNLVKQAGTGQNTFAANQQEWENAFAEGQFDFQKAQTAWENAFKEKDFEQQMKEAAASRGLQWANLTQRQKEFVADQAWKEKMFEYEMGQDAIANSNISPYVEEFSKLYITRDPSTGVSAISNPQALRNAIIGRNLSDEMTDQLLLQFGLQPG